MAQLLAAFCGRRPGVVVSLEVSNREALLRHLTDYTRDLAIMGRPPDGRGLSAPPS